MRDDKDRSGKWMIAHFGGSILRLGGVSGFQRWQPHQAEVVQPKQLPDGFLDVFFAGRGRPDPFLLEIATYPEQRVREQVLRDALLVFLDRRVLPDVVTLVLRPKGSLRLDGNQELQSQHGSTRITCSWRVVELWTVPAGALLAREDPGLIPWVPLTHFEEPPAAMIRRCRERIDQLAPPDVHDNLLAVTQVMTRLRYNDPDLLTLLGGTRVMIDSPLIREIVAEAEARAEARARQKAILTFLKGRFGRVPRPLGGAVRAINSARVLDELVALAGRCRTLEEFEAAVASRQERTG